MKGRRKDPASISASVLAREMDLNLRDRLYENAKVMKREDTYRYMKAINSDTELSDEDVRIISLALERAATEEQRLGEDNKASRIWFFFDFLISTGAKVNDLVNELRKDVDGQSHRMRFIQVDPVRKIVWFNNPKPTVFEPVVVSDRFIEHYKRYCKYLFIDPNSTSKADMYKPMFGYDDTAGARYYFGRAFNIAGLFIKDRNVSCTRDWFERKMVEVSGGNSVFVNAQMRRSLNTRPLYQYASMRSAISLQEELRDKAMNRADEMEDGAGTSMLQELSKKILFMENKDILKLCEQMRRQLRGDGDKKVDRLIKSLGLNSSI